MYDCGNLILDIFFYFFYTYYIHEEKCFVTKDKHWKVLYECDQSSETFLITL